MGTPIISDGHDSYRHIYLLASNFQLFCLLDVHDLVPFVDSALCPSEGPSHHSNLERPY